MKQRRPAATDDGMKDDAVLVDEPQLLERRRELRRSDEDTSLGLRFQRRDRLAQVTLDLDRVLPRKVAPRARHDVLRLRFELLRPLSHRARRLFVACHRRPGFLHQLVGVAPEQHRPALIHELRPIVVQLVVHDSLGVIDAPVQSHVETEGEEAHGVGYYYATNARGRTNAKVAAAVARSLVPPLGGPHEAALLPVVSQVIPQSPQFSVVVIAATVQDAPSSPQPLETPMIKVSVMYPNQPGARFDHDYYRDKHMPLIAARMGAYCLKYTVDKGLAGGTPATPPTYIAMCHIYAESVEAFNTGFGPHAKEIRGDLPNYTDLKPVLQISEVVVG